MTTRCPYCDIEVSESAIEAEDGCCPECGSVITAPSNFMGEDDLELDDELGDGYGDEEDDDFLDDDDFYDDDDDFEDDFDDEAGDFDDDKF